MYANVRCFVLISPTCAAAEPVESQDSEEGFHFLSEPPGYSQAMNDLLGFPKKKKSTAADSTPTDSTSADGKQKEETASISVSAPDPLRTKPATNNANNASNKSKTGERFYTLT